MTKLRRLPLTLLLAVLAPATAFAQAHPCCETATCLTAEEEAVCLSFPPPFGIDPWDAGIGGTGICGINHPAGILCTSFCENNPFGFCVACADPNACNYGVSAESADGCDYPDLGYDCYGDCLADINSNGICDNFETFGCLDEVACNFNPDADADAGNCYYALNEYDCNGNCLDDDGDGICNFNEISGCTDSLALNHYSFVTEDDGTCIYLSDLDFDTPPTPNCTSDLNGDNLTTIADVILMLSYLGIFCPQ